MKNSLWKKGMATLLSVCLTLGLFFSDFVRIGNEIHDVLAANYGNMTAQGDDSPYWTNSANPPSSITNIPGINISSQTGRYSMTNGSDGAVWMCIQSSQSSPTGKTGTIYACSNSDTFTDSSGYLTALNGLTYSQIAVAAYQYGRASDAAWCYAHTILSYVLSGDNGWYSQICSNIAGREALSNAAVAIKSRASGISGSATFYIFVTANGQNLLAMGYTPIPQVARIRLQKVDENGQGLAGAEFTLTGTFDQSSVRVTGAQGTPTISGNTITFTTGTGLVEIEGLAASSNFTFTETRVPGNYTAPTPASVSFTTDATGAVSGATSGNWAWNSSSYTYTVTNTSRPSGEVTFRKVWAQSDGTIVKLKNAGIELRSVTGIDLSSSNITVEELAGRVTERTSSYIRFYTGDGEENDVIIRGLPEGQYYFTEVDVPDGVTRAPDQSVTVSADGSCTPGTVVMTDAEQPRGDWGSLALNKVWYGSSPLDTYRFWNSVENVAFSVIGAWSFDDVQHYINNELGYRGAHAFADGTLYQTSISGNSAQVYWTFRTEGGQYIGPVNTTGPSYFEYLNGETYVRWADGAAPCINYLPRDTYYVVTESWRDGQFWEGDRAVYINTANVDSGWHELSYNSSTGEHVYVGIFHVADDGCTYLCEWGSTLRHIRPLSVEGGHAYWENDYYIDSVVNDTETASLDVTKTDETGTNAAGVRFEIHTTGSNSLVATSSSLTPIAGTNSYNVSWNYTVLNRGNFRYWHNDNGFPDDHRIGGYSWRASDYRDYQYNLADFSWPLYMGGPDMQYIAGVNNYSLSQFLDVYDDYLAHPENYTTDPYSVADWRAGRNMVPAYFGQNFNRATLNLNEISETNADVVRSLNYGDYYIYEYIEDSRGNNIIGSGGYVCPDGWTAYDEDAHRDWHPGDPGEPDYFYTRVTLDENHHTVTLNVECTNRQYSFAVDVNKVDESTGSVLTAYSGTFECELWIDVNENGIIDTGDEYVGTATDESMGTDRLDPTEARDGVIHFNYLYETFNYTDPDNFPTHFLVRETVAPSGYYLNDNPISAVVSSGNSYHATINCVDVPYIELNFSIAKYDEWTNQILSNYTGSHDATFEIWVDVNNDGQITSADRLLETLTDDDRDGQESITYILDYGTIRAKFPECIDGDGSITGESAKNYPTHYLVREVLAPFDFYLNPNVFPINLTGRQYVEIAQRTNVTETPYTAQIHMFKLDGDTSDVIRNAQFTIYNDVDGNKVYTEGVDTVAQTWNETDGLHDAQCVWNARLGCYVSSPLRSGNYVVVETGLPSGYFYVGANGQPTLARNEAYIEITPKDVSTTSADNPREDVYEATVYNLAPSIATTLHDPVTMSQTAHVDDDIELIDTVSYTNLVPNVEVRLDAVIMVKESGQPLLDANGNQVTGYAVFTPQTPDGTVDVTIHVNTNYVMSLVEDGTLNAPVDLVCFETLSFTATTDLTPYHQWYDDNPIAEHKEIGDIGQTVRVAELHTGVYDSQTMAQVASTGPNGDGYATIIDHVHYEGLQPNHTYTMRGEMHLLTYDADGNAVDGGVLNGADSREILHPTTTFTPTEQEGYVDVTYVINTNRYRGQTTVSYEYCEDNGRTIVFHNDIEDLPQTLFIPDVHTNAYCPDTTPGEMGRTVIGLGERARIVDEVSYSNLLVDGREYMVQGTLYWMYQDENGAIHSGPMSDLIGEAQATATMTFKPEEHGGQNGTIEMTFTFDSRVLADLHYDRLVVCETIFANGGIGWKPICHHWDFQWENNAQSIYVPDVHTTAFTEVGTTLPEGQMPDIQTRVVTDRVYYENLIPNTEYTVVGNVQYAMVDENGNISEWGDLVQNGQAVTGQTTFVPTSSSGYVDVTFTVNVSDILAKGYDKLVCFESVYSSPGILCAIHADISDSEQDIDIPELHTTALGANSRHNVQATANTEIIDSIYYEGLPVGRELRFETDLMSSKTHESIAHVTTLFTPTTSSGVLTVTITADLTGYTAGDYVVVFEDCYDNETGILIKSHHDWNDTDQTVETGGGGDTGILDVNANKYLYCAMACVLALVGLVSIEEIKKRRLGGQSNNNTES